MDVDTTRWSILARCGCPECRYREHLEMIRQVFEATREHPWSFTMWLPPIPFAWPTTQKAITA
jgi:hypothetical protein